MTGPHRFRMGDIEIDLDTGELRSEHTVERLQERPLAVLSRLVASPGALVTREELKRTIWAEDRFGDLDHRLNNAVHRLRVTLRDDAREPKWIHTVARRGYRFSGEIEAVPERGEESVALRGGGISPLETKRPPAHALRSALWFGLGAGAVLVLVILGDRSPWPPLRFAELSSTEPSARVELRAPTLPGPAATCSDAPIPRRADDLVAARELAFARLAESPGSSEAWGSLALVQHLLGAVGVLAPAHAGRLATEAAERALAIDADEGLAHLALAETALWFDRRPQVAAGHFLRALQLRPGCADSHHGYGRLLAYEGRLDEALVALDHADRLSPGDVSILLDRGSVLFELGRHDEANALVAESIRLEPRSPKAQLVAAGIARREGREEQRLIRLRLAAQFGSDTPKIAFAVTRELLDAGAVDEASAVFERIRSRTDRYLDPDAVREIGRALATRRS